MDEVTGAVVIRVRAEHDIAVGHDVGVGGDVAAGLDHNVGVGVHA